MLFAYKLYTLFPNVDILNSYSKNKNKEIHFGTTILTNYRFYFDFNSVSTNVIVVVNPG